MKPYGILAALAVTGIWWGNAILMVRVAVI
jgi:hypothetical protein